MQSTNISSQIIHKQLNNSTPQTIIIQKCQHNSSFNTQLIHSRSTNFQPQKSNLMQSYPINLIQPKQKPITTSLYSQQNNFQISPKKQDFAEQRSSGYCNSIGNILSETINYAKSHFGGSIFYQFNDQQKIQLPKQKNNFCQSTRIQNHQNQYNAFDIPTCTSQVGLKIPTDRSYYMLRGSQVSQKSSTITIVKVIQLNPPKTKKLIQEQWNSNSYFAQNVQRRSFKPKLQELQKKGIIHKESIKQSSSSSNVSVPKLLLPRITQKYGEQELNHSSDQKSSSSAIPQSNKSDEQNSQSSNIPQVKPNPIVSAIQSENQYLFLSSIEEINNRNSSQINPRFSYRKQQQQIIHPHKKSKEQFAFCLEQQCLLKPIYSRAVDRQVQQHQYHSKINYKEIESYFENFKSNFNLSQQYPNQYQTVKSNLLDIVINLRQLEFKITDQLKSLRLEAQKHIKMVILSFGERVYEQRIKKLREDEILDEKFIRTCLDQLQEYSKVKYLNINFPLKSSQKIKNDIEKVIQPFELEWDRSFTRFKKRLLIEQSALIEDSMQLLPRQSLKQIPLHIYKQLRSLNTFLYPRTSETYKFSNYFKSNNYEVLDGGYKLIKSYNQQMSKSRLNTLTSVCFVQKRFQPGSEVCFEIGELTGMLGIGLLDLNKSKQAKFSNCIKYGVFMDNFGRLIPTNLEEILNAKFFGLEIKTGDQIRMGITKFHQVYFKKGGFFNKSSYVPLKNIFGQNLFNLYPCVYLQNSGTQIKIIKE